MSVRCVQTAVSFTLATAAPGSWGSGGLCFRTVRVPLSIEVRTEAAQRALNTDALPFIPSSALFAPPRCTRTGALLAPTHLCVLFAARFP